jgi:hypothetical protein
MEALVLAGAEDAFFDAPRLGAGVEDGDSPTIAMVA